eukprot:74835_1
MAPKYLHHDILNQKADIFANVDIVNSLQVKSFHTPILYLDEFEYLFNTVLSPYKGNKLGNITIASNMILSFEMKPKGITEGTSTIMYIGDNNNSFLHIYFESNTFDLVISWLGQSHTLMDVIDFNVDQFIKILISNDILAGNVNNNTFSFNKEPHVEYLGIIADIWATDSFDKDRNVAFVDLKNIQIQSYSIGIEYGSGLTFVSATRVEKLLDEQQRQIQPFYGLFFMPFDNNIISFNVYGEPVWSSKTQTAFDMNKFPYSLCLNKTSAYLTITDNADGTLWNRQANCDFDDAQYIYQLNFDDKLKIGQSLYDIDCSYKLTLISVNSFILYDENNFVRWDSSIDDSYQTRSLLSFFDCNTFVDMCVFKESNDHHLILDGAGGDMVVFKIDTVTNNSQIEWVRYRRDINDTTLDYIYTASFIESNQNIRDYNLRCWSSKYQFINKYSIWMTSLFAYADSAECEKTFDDSNGLDYFARYWDFVDTVEIINKSNSLLPICVMGKICGKINHNYFNKLWGFTNPQVSVEKCNSVSLNNSKLSCGFVQNYTKYCIQSEYMLFNVTFDDNVDEISLGLFNFIADDDNIEFNISTNATSLLAKGFTLTLSKRGTVHFSVIGKPIFIERSIVTGYNETIFFMEWDTWRDYVRFGYVGYMDNIFNAFDYSTSNIVFETSYEAMIDTKLIIENILIDKSHAHLVNIVDTNNTKKPCFGYGKNNTYYDYIRITSNTLDSENEYYDNCNGWNWRRNENDVFHWIVTEYDHIYHSCFHGKFLASTTYNFNSVQSKYIVEVDHDFITFKFDIFSVCKWYKNKTVSFLIDNHPYWTGSRDISRRCDGYKTTSWLNFPPRKSNITMYNPNVNDYVAIYPKTIGQISIYENIMIEFDFRMLYKLQPNDYSIILHIGNDIDEKYPLVLLFETYYETQMIIFFDTNFNYTVPNSFELYQKYYVNLQISNQFITLYIDDQVIMNKGKDSHTSIDQLIYKDNVNINVGSKHFENYKTAPITMEDLSVYFYHDNVISNYHEFESNVFSSTLSLGNVIIKENVAITFNITVNTDHSERDKTFYADKLILLRIADNCQHPYCDEFLSIEFSKHSLQIITYYDRQQWTSTFLERKNLQIDQKYRIEFVITKYYITHFIDETLIYNYTK